MHTLEELNTAFWAWDEIEYNERVNSETGETPNQRYLKGLRIAKGSKDQEPIIRRVTDIETFNAMFLWKDTRTVSKYGKIKLHNNKYPVQSRPPKTVVQVRYDPFYLDEVYIYDVDNTFLEKTTPCKKINNRVPDIPEESKKTVRQVSQDSVNYFTKLREKLLEEQKSNNDMLFSKLKESKDE